MRGRNINNATSTKRAHAVVSFDTDGTDSDNRDTPPASPDTDFLNGHS